MKRAKGWMYAPDYNFDNSIFDDECSFDANEEQPVQDTAKDDPGPDFSRSTDKSTSRCSEIHNANEEPTEPKVENELPGFNEKPLRKQPGTGERNTNKLRTEEEEPSTSSSKVRSPELQAKKLKEKFCAKKKIREKLPNRLITGKIISKVRLPKIKVL